MNWHSILTDVGVIVALLGFLGLLAKALIDFHASRPAAEKISVETFADVTKELDRLEDKIIKLRADNDVLRDRVDALEHQLKLKDAELVTEQENIEILQRQLDELKIFVRSLLSDLDARGIEHSKPSEHLLKTNPRIPPVKKT